MPRDISPRLSIVALLLVTVTVIGAAFTLFTPPVTAAPRAQANVPNLRLSADTTITVTVAITDGQVIVVPVALNIVGRQLQGAANVALIAGVEQQPGVFIGVVPAEEIPATVQLTDATGAVPTPAATTAADDDNTPNNVGGTHVANANSNLRAGPGTNFERVGRVPAGDTVVIVGQNDDGTWLQLDNGNWIAEFLVDPIEGGTPPPNATDDDNTSDNNNDDSNDNDNEPGDEQGDDEEAAEGTEQNALPQPELPDATPTALSDQAALAIYLVSIAEIGAGAGDAVTELQTLTQDPQPLNPVWRDDVGAQLDTLSTALDQYLALTPVPGYEDLHAEVTSVALTCEEAVDYLTGGLENPFNIDPNTAVESVQTCAAQAADLAVFLETIQ